MPSGYSSPANDGGYLRPTMPGIWAAVNATTSYSPWSRNTTLKLWKSRPAAPRMITFFRPMSTAPRRPFDLRSRRVRIYPSVPSDHGLNTFLPLAGRAFVPHPEGRAGPGGVAAGDGSQAARGLPAEVEAARREGTARRG